uniref:Uncharacterized protein n=1 Tax=Rhodosorus marinus TaxID=101924 RepID=A0A7S0BLM4_9RHOD|mmetsp:Transcript_22306/g.32229  ORF Transcript_22306/g.32229 Transcript_22306/m.32229 type:complete len:158 (+) Transcript_22306:184-657(+)
MRSLKVEVASIRLDRNESVKFLKFFWATGEVWVHLRKGKSVEVELPVVPFSVRIGTGKGKTAGIAEFPEVSNRSSRGYLKSTVADGDSCLGEIKLRYRNTSVIEVAEITTPVRGVCRDVSPMSLSRSSSTGYDALSSLSVELVCEEELKLSSQKIKY